MRYLFLICLLMITPLAADLRQELTPQDKQNINYIINTLSGKSAFALAFYQGSLEKAGKETKAIHPLAFLGYMYSDPSLKSKIPEITPIAWNRFKGDFIKTLNHEAGNGAITKESIAAFAKEVNIPEDQVAQIVKDRDWNQLFSLLSQK